MIINIHKSAYRAVTKFTLYLYLFFNFSCLLYFSLTGYLGGDFRNQNIPSDFLLLSISFLIILITFYLFLKVIPFFILKIKVKPLNNNTNLLIDIISFFVILFGIYSAISFKVGVFGLEDNDAINAPPIIRMTSALIQPVYFGLLYIFYRNKPSSNFYKLNYILYIIFIFSAGQTGQLLLLFMLFMYNSYVKKNTINFKKVTMIIAICILIYPIFRLLKDIVLLSYIKNTALLDNLDDIISSNFLETYLTYLFISLERFQIVANTQYIISNYNDLHSIYSLTQNDLSKFFSNYWWASFIIKSFGIGYNLLDYYSPQSYLAYSINGKDYWASHIGQIGYFIFYGYGGIVIFLYSVILSSITFLISKVISLTKSIQLLTWLLTLQLICHGWIFAYVSYLQSLLFFLAIVLIVKGCKSILNPRVLVT